MLRRSREKHRSDGLEQKLSTHQRPALTHVQPLPLDEEVSAYAHVGIVDGDAVGQASLKDEPQVGP